MRYIAIANPESKRWQTYAAELSRFWQQRGVAPDIAVVPWSVLVPRDGCVDGLAVFDRPALVRLESPGRDFEVAKLLLGAGVRATREAGFNPTTLTYEKGRLVRPRLLYEGFCRVLRELKTGFAARPHLRPLACPLAVAELFDKNATATRLAAAGIPVPQSLDAPATPAELLELLRRQRFGTAYVKLNTGSSASGIAVVHGLDAPPWAISSIVRIGDGFYSTRRLRKHTGEGLQAVLHFLLGEGVCVQRGVPMAQIDGLNFDVRVVVIHGQPRFPVFRLSPNPMTNLHLGGRRGDPKRCRAAIPTRAWLDALDHCVGAAGLFSCAVVGVDLVFERGYLRHHVLEVNAFGDFFPGLVDEQGISVHRAEIEMSLRQYGTG